MMTLHCHKFAQMLCQNMNDSRIEQCGVTSPYGASPKHCEEPVVNLQLQPLGWLVIEDLACDLQGKSH